MRRNIEKGNEAHFGADSSSRNVKGGNIPMGKTGGPCVIDIEVNVDGNDAELFTRRAGEQTETVRSSSQVRKVRFAIGPLEQGAAELAQVRQNTRSSSRWRSPKRPGH